MKTIQTKVDAILTATQPSANSPPTGGECRPAFPSTTEHGFNCGEPGMTLRDYFAAKAMQGMAGSHAYCERGWDQADLAGQAYEIADAMLKARSRGVEQSENDRRVAAQPVADDWIPWAGGGCPVGGAVIVQVKGRNGDLDTGKARLYEWRHVGGDGDIVAYQLVQK